MTEPAARKTRITAKAKRSGDHAPDQPPAHVPAPTPDPDAPLARVSPLSGRLPFYHQIADDLRRQIDTGELAPGQKLPSESQMVDTYQVSPPTIRKAIALLRSSGLLISRQGAATRVRTSIGIPGAEAFEFSPTPDREPAPFRDWEAEGWKQIGEPFHGRTNAARNATALGLSPFADVFILQRQLGHASGTFVISRVLIPSTTADGTDLEDDPFKAPAELRRILTEAGYDLRSRDSVAALMPTPAEAAILRLSDGVPLLVHTRVTLDASGTPLVLEETRLPADRATITLH